MIGQLCCMCKEMVRGREEVEPSRVQQGEKIVRNCPALEAISRDLPIVKVSLCHSVFLLKWFILMACVK